MADTRRVELARVGDSAHVPVLLKTRRLVVGVLFDAASPCGTGTARRRRRVQHYQWL